MRKIICLVLAAAFMLCLSPPVFAAGETTARTELSFRYSVPAPSYFVDSWVEKLPGNQNRLHITITEILPGGGVNIIRETFMIRNNAEDTYEVGSYSVFVDTKGNIQIRRAEVVSGTPSGYTAPETPIFVNASATADDFIGIAETAKNSKVWVLSFTVTEIWSDGTTKVVPYAIQLNANNANVSGRYDLGKYTLIYDISGGGSNIKDFKVVLN